MPEQDTGLIAGVTDAAQDVSFENMSILQQRIADIIAQDPDVISVISFVGVGDDNPTINSGRLYIDIGPPDRRNASAAEIMARLHDAVADVRDISLHLQPVQDIQIDSRLTPHTISICAAEPRRSGAAPWAGKFLRELQKQPDLADVTTDQQDLGQQMMITVDREAAARFGLNISTIVQHLYDAFGQRQIATIYGPSTSTKSFSKSLRNTATPPTRSKASISRMRALSRAGRNHLVRRQRPPRNFGSGAASAFAKLEKRLAPLVIMHQNEFPAVALSFNLPPGVSLGQALDTLRRPRPAIGLPRTIETNLVGSAAEFASSLKSQPFLIAAAIIAVYIVLGILYESYIHPITILSTLPSAGIGALLALMLFHQDLDPGVADRHYPA